LVSSRRSPSRPPRRVYVCVCRRIGLHPHPLIHLPTSTPTCTLISTLCSTLHPHPLTHSPTSTPTPTCSLISTLLLHPSPTSSHTLTHIHTHMHTNQYPPAPHPSPTPFTFTLSHTYPHPHPHADQSVPSCSTLQMHTSHPPDRTRSSNSLHEAPLNANLPLFADDDQPPNFDSAPHTPHQHGGTTPGG